MKVAPLYHALSATDWCNVRLVHTGQHYDVNMSDAFFSDLSLPKPDFHLGVGSGSHAEQTGGVMIAYEQVCLENRPDWIVVVGDVNSTAACSIVGAIRHRGGKTTWQRTFRLSLQANGRKVNARHCGMGKRRIGQSRR